MNAADYVIELIKQYGSEYALSKVKSVVRSAPASAAITHFNPVTGNYGSVGNNGFFRVWVGVNTQDPATCCMGFPTKTLVKISELSSLIALIEFGFKG